MEELATLVERSRSGDLTAFETLVRRFQDMACAYAYSILGDFHLAEDAAQEAFVDAYGKLDQLREPKAFAGWFRRIVFKHCDRVTRRKRVPTVPLDKAPDAPDRTATPSQQVERRELAEQVLEAVSALPEHQRTATALFYINGYSQNDIADFLEVPVTTVKKRLHDSRKRLKERLLTMVEDTLKQSAPDERFSQKVIDELRNRPRPLEMEGHPVRDAVDAIRAALPEYEYIEGDEAVAKRDSGGVYATHDNVYHVDDDTVLRSCTTVTTVRAAVGRTPPVRILTAGRVFRPDQSSADEIRLNVFHQVDVLCIAPGVDMEQMKCAVRTAVAAVLGPVEPKWRPHAYPCFTDSFEVEIERDGGRLGVAGCGMVVPETLEKAGFDTNAVSGFAFGMGMERLAMLKLGLDNVQKLWEPPFVRR